MCPLPSTSSFGRITMVLRGCGQVPEPKCKPSCSSVAATDASEYGFCKYSQLHMSVRHDHEHERTERKTSRLQPTHTSVGVLPQSHPGLCGTQVGPGKDTHGTPVPQRRKAVSGPTQAPRDDPRQKTQPPGVDTHLETYSFGVCLKE